MSNQVRIVAISVSLKKGIPKTNVEQAHFVADFGIEGDAHAGPWHRQVSLLADESINKIRAKGLANIKSGAFAENITTTGIQLESLPLGTQLQLGAHVVLEITQIGKECHHHCAIYQTVGDCVMPREGIFARVLTAGLVCVGDTITILPRNQLS